MPIRALRPCATPQCPALVPYGRCATHQTAQHREEDARRGSRHQRGYGTQWDQLRAVLLPQKIVEYKARCHLCGGLVRDAKAPHPLSPTLDHIVPKSKGGTDDPSNLALAHYGCNSARGNRAPTSPARQTV